MAKDLRPTPHGPTSRPPLETVTYERPRCPACRGTRLTKYRSLANQGDGSSLSWVRCQCGHRFRMILE